MQHSAAVTKHFLYTDRMSAILFQYRVYQSLSLWIPAFFGPYCCKITAASAFRPFDACSQRESAFSLGTSDFNHMSCKSIIELLWILFLCARTTFQGCVKYAVFSAICHTVRENRLLKMKQPKDGRLPLPRLFCFRIGVWAIGIWCATVASLPAWVIGISTGKSSLPNEPCRSVLLSATRKARDTFCPAPCAFLEERAPVEISAGALCRFQGEITGSSRRTRSSS